MIVFKSKGHRRVTWVGDIDAPAETAMIVHEEDKPATKLVDVHGRPIERTRIKMGFVP